MKISIISILGIAAAGLILSGCQKENTVPGNDSASEGTEISVMGFKDGSTKTIMNGNRQDGFSTLWEVGDKLGVYGVPQGESNTLNNYALEILNEEGSIVDNVATFKGTIQSNGTYTFYTYYPHTGSSSSTNTNIKVNASIPSTQTMHGESYDRSCDYMIGTPFEFTYSTEWGAADIEKNNISFGYVVGFINLSVAEITGGTDAAGKINLTDEVVAVELTVNDPDGTAPVIAGDFSFDLANGDADFGANDGTRNSIKLNTMSGMTIGDLSAWFVTKPFVLPMTGTIEFLITTKTHTIKKTIEVSAMGSAFELQAGGVKTFNMKIDDDCTIESEEAVISFDILYSKRTNSTTGVAMNNPLEVYTLTYTGTEGTIEASSITAGGSFPTSNVGTGYWGATGNFSNKNVTPEIRLSSSPDGWMMFTVTIDRQVKALSFTNLKLVVKRDNANVVRNFEIQYSLDAVNYSILEDLDITSVSGSSSYKSFDVPFGDALQDIAVPSEGLTVTFRIVPYGSTAVNGRWGLFTQTLGQPGLRLTGGIVE